MPIYEYVCTACDHRADILQGINDPGPNFCPSCGREGTMRKLFAPPTIHFKGSGWAKKDRGSANATRASKASSGDGAKDGAGGSTSTSDGGSDSGSSSPSSSSSSSTSSSTSSTSSGDTPKPSTTD